MKDCRPGSLTALMLLASSALCAPDDTGTLADSEGNLFLLDSINNYVYDEDPRRPASLSRVKRPADLYTIRSGAGSVLCRELLAALNEPYDVADITVQTNLGFTSDFLLGSSLSLPMSSLYQGSGSEKRRNVKTANIDINNNGTVETLGRVTTVVEGSVITHMLYYADGVLLDEPLSQSSDPHEWLANNVPLNFFRMPRNDPMQQVVSEYVRRTMQSIDYPLHSYVSGDYLYFEPVEVRGKNYLLATYSPTEQRIAHPFLLNITADNVPEVACVFRSNRIFMDLRKR